MGRFLSPDPYNAGADPTNPQSWNMYSYVNNNPLNAVDPSGKGVCDDLGQEACLVAASQCNAYQGLGECETYNSNLQCQIDGVSSDCGFVMQGVQNDFAAPCPDNACSGFGTDANGNTSFALYYAFAGGLSGYYNPTDISQAVYDWNGQLLTHQGWVDDVLQPYSDSMKPKVANALGTRDIWACGPDAGVIGGNANFCMSGTNWTHGLALQAGCSSPGSDGYIGPGVRCDFVPAMHFESGGGQYWVHMDTANPTTGLLGLFLHGFVDGFLGNTFLASGVPH